MHVLFAHPDAYSTYVAGSPSIWWNNREVLKGENAFATAVRSGRVQPRVLITSDGWEQDPQKMNLPSAASDRAAIVAAVGKQRMVDNAHQLADRLAAIPGKGAYRVRYVLFPEETHFSGLPAASSRGFAFALSPW